MYDIDKIREVLNQEQTLRQCAKCKKLLPANLDHFYKSKQHKDGLSSYCKECHLKLNKAYRKTEKGKKTTQRYYEKNREKFKQYNKINYEKNREKLNQYYKNYKIEHPERIKRLRKRIIREALFYYVLNRYFEYKEGTVIRYDFFYHFLLEIAKKFHLSYSKYYVTRLLNKDKKIILPFMEKSNSVRLRQKKILGLKLKKKGGKTMEVSNLGNIEIETSNLTSEKVCMMISCKPGQKELEEIYNSLNPLLKARINYPSAIDYYKKLEKILFRKNVYRSTNVKIATVLYLASDLTQDNCSDLCGICTPTLRILLKKVLRLKTSQMDKIREANKTEPTNDGKECPYSKRCEFYESNRKCQTDFTHCYTHFLFNKAQIDLKKEAK